MKETEKTVVTCPKCGEYMGEIICQDSRNAGWLCSRKCRTLISLERITVEEYNVRKAYLKG